MVNMIASTSDILPMHTGEESMRNSKGDFVGGDLHHAHGMKGDGSPDLVEDGQPIIVAPVGRLK